MGNRSKPPRTEPSPWHCCLIKSHSWSVLHSWYLFSISFTLYRPVMKARAWAVYYQKKNDQSACPPRRQGDRPTKEFVHCFLYHAVDIYSEAVIRSFRQKSCGLDSNLWPAKRQWVSWPSTWCWDRVQEERGKLSRFRARVGSCAPKLWNMNSKAVASQRDDAKWRLKCIV